MRVGGHDIHIFRRFGKYGDIACPAPSFGCIGQDVCTVDIGVFQIVFRIDVALVWTVEALPRIFRALYIIVKLTYGIDIFGEHTL